MRWFRRELLSMIGMARIISRRIAGSPRRVILYKSRSDRIGDITLLTGVVPHYRQLYPDATLEMICPDIGVEIMQVTGVFDAVWPLSQLSSRNGKPLAINAGRADIVISLRRNVAPHDAQWFKALRPSKVYGFSGDTLTHSTGALSTHKKLLNITVELPNEGGSSKIHELVAQQRMLEMLGEKVELEGLYPHISDEFSDYSIADGVDEMISAKSPFYLCAPCGSQPIRTYPTHKWCEVFSALAPCTIAICGSGSDWKMGLELSTTPIDGVKILDLVGQTSLRQLAGLMKRADVVLAAENGPMHLAIALKRPVVAICGLGHYGRFVPYPYQIENARFLFGDCKLAGCNWKCPFPYPHCVDDIESAVIISAIRDLL